MNLGNCPRCGKLFTKGFNEVCPACVKAIDEDYNKCAKYLRENRGSTLQQLSDATEVSVKQIMKFIRDGRINIATLPNMQIHCESCGTPMKGLMQLCEDCRKRLNRDVTNTLEDQRRAEELRKKESQSARFYIDDRLKKDR